MICRRLGLDDSREAGIIGALIMAEGLRLLMRHDFVMLWIWREWSGRPETPPDQSLEDCATGLLFCRFEGVAVYKLKQERELGCAKFSS